MVRAILAGQKVQTRRVVKNVPSWDHFGKDIMDWSLSGIHQEGYGEDDQLDGTDRWYLDVQTDVDDHSRKVIRCPYGQPGDHLWVKERAAFYWGGWHYFADGPSELGPDVSPLTFSRPSIHMPRSACRIVLEITGVRVERLQDITEEDATAEGITDGGCLNCGESEPCQCSCPEPSRRDSFAHLWMQINGTHSWQPNPWVWVIEFKRIKS